MITLIHGDCLEKMKGLADGSIDLTVTSPPYDNLRTNNGRLDWGNHVWKPVIQELFRVIKQGGVVVWVVGDATIKGSETGTSFRQALYFMECGFNLHDTMIWEKHSFNYDPRRNRYKQHYEFMFILSKGKPSVFNPIKDVPVKTAGKLKKSSKRMKNGEIRDFGYIKMNDFQARSDVWYIPQETRSEHPAPFPEKLAEDHILSWSNEGDTVLDPFMGSGTTGKMAVLNKRNFIGIEKDADYFKIAESRINDTHS
jgi:site-specific DNA-methyltransferase (adenine-specific)